MALGWNTYLLFNSDIVNFVWKTDEREIDSTVLLIFAFGSALIVGEWGVVGWCRKSYLGLADIASFSRRDFSQSNKYGTFWRVASTGYFYVLISWAIAVGDFRPLENCKNLGLPLSTITFTANNHADYHSCKYIYLFQISCRMKLVFLLKYTLTFWPRFFIFKFDSNVKHRLYFFK